MMHKVLLSVLIAAGGIGLAGEPRGLAASAIARVPSKRSRGAYAEVRGQRLFYRVSGQGPALLLLHGGLSSSEDFRTIVPMLARRFRVITVDRVGHGRSSDSGDPFFYDAMAEDMKAFLDFLGIRATLVVGWSDGGIVGYHLASRYPGLVSKLITMGSNTRVEGMSPEALEWIKGRPTPESLLADLPEVAEAYKRLSPNPQRLLEFVRRSRELWLRGPYITREDLNRIKAPVLLIAGDSHDVRVEHLLELRASLGQAQLCILPGASHDVLQDKPQLLRVILEGFLSPAKP